MIETCQANLRKHELRKSSAAHSYDYTMINDTRIRFAQSKDLPKIIILCKLHAAFERAEYDETNKQQRLLHALFTDQPKVKCLVLEIKDEVVGYATYMSQFSTWDADMYLYLDCLYIEEAYRGAGFGELLMLKIKDQAIALGIREIQWQTPDFNLSAIGFYKKLGGVSKRKQRFFWHSH